MYSSYACVYTCTRTIHAVQLKQKILYIQYMYMYMYNVHVYVHCYMCVHVHVSVITFTTFRTTAVVNIPANIQHVCTCI